MCKICKKNRAVTTTRRNGEWVLCCRDCKTTNNGG